MNGSTDTFEDPKPHWLTRKREYIAHLRTADTYTCVVAAADKLHNARCILHDLRRIGADVFKRFKGTAEQTGWYYARVARELHHRLAATDAAGIVNALLADIESIATHSHGQAFAIGVALGRLGKDWPEQQ